MPRLPLWSLWSCGVWIFQRNQSSPFECAKVDMRYQSKEKANQLEAWLFWGISLPCHQAAHCHTMDSTYKFGFPKGHLRWVWLDVPPKPSEKEQEIPFECPATVLDFLSFATCLSSFIAPPRPRSALTLATGGDILSLAAGGKEPTSGVEGWCSVVLCVKAVCFLVVFEVVWPGGKTLGAKVRLGQRCCKGFWDIVVSPRRNPPKLVDE